MTFETSSPAIIPLAQVLISRLSILYLELDNLTQSARDGDDSPSLYYGRRDKHREIAGVMRGGVDVVRGLVGEVERLACGDGVGGPSEDDRKEIG